MNAVDNILSIKGGEAYITNVSTNAYRVNSGTVLVFVVPLVRGDPGRRSFIYQAEAGEVIPAFVYRDIEYCEWRFCFTALEKASLQVIENGATRLLKDRFSRRAHIRNFETEGYCGGLVDQYRFNIVTEDGFIRRSERQREDTAKKTRALIRDAFIKKKAAAVEEASGDLLYDAAALLCRSRGIAIAPFEKLREACGEQFTVSDIARVSHFSYRQITLSEGWEKTDSGSFLGFDERGKPYVCLSKGTHSYTVWDMEHGRIVPTDKISELISPQAFTFYCSLPNRRLRAGDMVSFCLKRIRAADLVLLGVLSLITALIGLLTPILSQSIYDKYIPLGAKGILFQFGCLLISFMLANVMFSVVKSICAFRISSKMAYDMQSAIYDRLFKLPESFFRSFDSADIAQRVMSVGPVVNTLAGAAISSAVALVFAIAYLVKMAGYSGKLTLIGLLSVAVYSGLYYAISVGMLKHKARSAELDGRTGSIMFQLLNGISKIRIAGVEDRAVYEYMRPYVMQRNEEAKADRLGDLGNALDLAAGTLFSMVFYTVIIRSGADISLGAFIAFQTLFGSFSAYVTSLVGNLVQCRNMKPSMERLRPITEAVPEYDDAQELPGELSGEIEINNVSFAYREDMPLVLNGIDLKIKAGEYIGIVGSSGCGKSTLIKLLLGFERPVSGKIYYDDKDIESLDKCELRKKMGVVLQSGGLISGSIFENITITAPGAAVKDVNEAVAAVGLSGDIAEMPMGLHTVLSEDCGTISGGQQQRILIARAIISKPRILLFDEATSALDNVTQSIVCDTLEKLDSTRIVIAHRLSTVIRCDRIIVMDKGRVIGQGTYDELMADCPLFRQLASRQMI